MNVNLRLPDAWDWATLGHLSSEIDYGLNEEADENGEGETFLRISDIDDDGKLVEGDRKNLRHRGLAEARLLLRAGDIVIARSGSIGRSFLVSESEAGWAFASYLIRFRPRSELVEPNYLASVLRSSLFRGYVDRVGRAVAQPNINSKELARFRLPLPTPFEQQRIVEVLRQAEGSAVLRKSLTAQLNTIRDEFAMELFGDLVANERRLPVKALGAMSEIVRGSSPRPQGDPRLFGGPVPRLMVSDLTRDGLWVSAKTDSLTEEGAKYSRWMDAGSVVIAVSGAPGLSAILDHGSCIHDGFVGFRGLSDELDPVFLAYTLNILRQRHDQQAVGAVFRNLTTDQVKGIKVPIPPKELQARFVRFLSASREVEQLIGKAKDLHRDLFREVSLAAFAGEVTEEWRHSHREIIDNADRERHTAFVKGTERISVGITEQARVERISDEIPPARVWLYEQLSEFQHNVWLAMREWKGTVVPEDTEGLAAFCSNPGTAWPIEHEGASPDRIKRTLEQLAALGLIAKVLIPNANGKYITAFRRLREGEDTRLADASRLETLLRQETARS